MNAKDLKLITLLDGNKQFIVPIFQRDYSWGTKQCQQLWNDILRVGKDSTAQSHFLGPVVYIASEQISADIPRYLLIDGQQRLTTVMLLLAAVRDYLLTHPTNGTNPPSAEEVEESFLCNRRADDSHRCKLMLRRSDDEALSALLNRNTLPDGASESLRENYAFFQEKLENVNLGDVYTGIKKLVIVDVSLTRGNDDPQMIFESLNSTGLELTQADLIRNFVLMDLDDESQTRLYETYWQLIEAEFGNKYRVKFDEFCRDFLVLKLRLSKQLRSGEIYQHFRTYFHNETEKRTIDEVLEELQRFAGYYVRFSLNRENNAKLSAPVDRLRGLVEAVSPLMLRLYDCNAQTDAFDDQDFSEAIELLESYVFRRSACDMQTRSLYQISAGLAFKISDHAPLDSLKVALYSSTPKRRFPSNTEFCDALVTRDIYSMRSCGYLLNRLENNSNQKNNKEQLVTAPGIELTIEHVMPQNPKLSAEWKAMLGSNWKEIHQTWLHRLGNLTLTGYNPEYGDRSFETKKTMKDGFKSSPLRLNYSIRDQDSWSEAVMEQRGKELAQQAVEVWPELSVETDVVQAIELEWMIETADHHSIEEIGFDSEARSLFDTIQPHIQALGSDVSEIICAKSVVYRVFDHFLEVLPRKDHILLSANLDFDETDDPSGVARDASNRTFIPNATETGGVLFLLKEETDISAAMHIVRQAYALVTE